MTVTCILIACNRGWVPGQPRDLLNQSWTSNVSGSAAMADSLIPNGVETWEPNQGHTMCRGSLGAGLCCVSFQPPPSPPSGIILSVWKLPLSERVRTTGLSPRARDQEAPTRVLLSAHDGPWHVSGAGCYWVCSERLTCPHNLCAYVRRHMCDQLEKHHPSDGREEYNKKQ